MTEETQRLPRAPVDMRGRPMLLARRPKIRLARPQAPVEGRLLASRYRVMAQLGAGGMGRVFSAIDVLGEREVAVKVLNPTAMTSTNLTRFRREAAAASSVQHERLCRVHQFGVDQGMPFIVMDRLEGETLRQRLKAASPLPIPDAVTIMLQLLDGLSAAHAAGVIHRDVKPGNVFLTSPRGMTPQLKIIDFGLAKLVAGARSFAMRDEATSITETDVIPGTAQYLSPEQLSGVRDIDARVDVWAAGLTMYELLAGRRAYDAVDYADLARSIVMDELPPVRIMRTEVPEEIARVLSRAIAKRRQDRFASAAEFRNALLAAWARHRAAGIAHGALLRVGAAHRTRSSRATTG